MNHYTFEEIEVGMKESFSVTVTEGMMDSFRDMTGDLNPLHRDHAFAVEKGFPGKVNFGMMTASFLSTLAGVYLPGERSLIQNVELKFMKPVFPGDNLLVTGTVAEKNEAFQVIRLKVEIRNDRSEKVLRGSMQIGFLEEES